MEVQLLDDEFYDLGMEECYEGYETRKITMEERNVFCSSYNVFVLENKYVFTFHFHFFIFNHFSIF